MTALGIQALTKASGTRVVPDLADYDGVSPGWSEVEYRAQLVDTRSVTGFWEGEPGWVAFDSWPYNEVCVIVSGRVAIEDPDGVRVEFSAGDAFTVPAGFRGVWHTLEPTKKVFVGVETDTEGRSNRNLS